MQPGQSPRGFCRATALVLLAPVGLQMEAQAVCPSPVPPPCDHRFRVPGGTVPPWRVPGHTRLQAAWARPWGALQPRCLPSRPTGSVRVTQGQPQAGPPRCGPCCWLYCHFDKDVNGVSCGPQVFVLGPLCGCATLALTVSPKCDRSLGLQCLVVPEGVGE